MSRPWKVGANTLDHRIVLAPLTRIRANTDLCVTDLHVEYYGQRASKGGLLISEATVMCEQSIASNHIPGIFTEEQAKAWKKVTDAVHAKGGFISCQLWHQGRVAHRSYSNHPLAVAAGATVCESAGDVGLTYSDLAQDNTMQPHVAPHKMTLDDIARLKQQYVRAAKLAIDVAGFDYIELHGAHGYLLDQFHNSGTNNRTDQYGGSIANRIRLTVEVLRLMKETVGEDKLAIRISPHTNTNGFFMASDEDPDALYKALYEAFNEFKLAYLLVTEPRWERSYTGDCATDPMYLAPAINLDKFKGLYKNGPIIGAGGYTPVSAKNNMNNPEGYDAIGFGRFFISNPDIVERVRLDLPLNRYDRSTFYINGAEFDKTDLSRGYTDYPTFEQTLAAVSSYTLEEVRADPAKMKEVVEKSQSLPYPLAEIQQIGVTTNSSQRA